jgi:hypothetical protein
MIHISRSAVVTRKTCEMKRFWNYHATPFAGQTVPGIVPLTASPRSELPKLRGQIFHEAAARLFDGGDWQSYISEACRTLLHPDLFPDEQAVLVRRALLGWSVVRAEVLNDYTVVSAEQEWVWPMAADVAQTLRLDRVLRRKDDGTLAIFDFKTLKAPDPNWVERLQHSEQTHLYIQALRERADEWVMGMIYDGLIIGSLDEQHHQKSPFVRAYRRKDGSWSAKYVAGAPAVTTCDWDDAEWLAWAQETGILPDLYCTTGPLLPPTDHLIRTKQATVEGERRWALRLEELASVQDDPEAYQLAWDSLIERTPDACLKYGIDYACPYHALCWQGAQPEPDAFTTREDHHALDTTPKRQ